MLLLDKTREEKLIDLAKACFDPPPSEAEEKVLRDSASSLDQYLPQANAPRPTIRSEFVRWLATDPTAATYIDPKGLRAYGITLPGKLDLQSCRILVTLDFRQCTMKSEIDLLFAETRGVWLLDSLLDRGISADGIDVDGPLFLRGSSFSGEVRLLGAKIKGVLDCISAKLQVTEGNALSADAAEIGGGVFLRESFESSGTIRLLGAKIKGDLSCSGAKLRVKEGNALVADGAEIGGSIFLNEDFESGGAIRLPGAKIKGDLECPGAKLNVADGDALSAGGAEIGGNVFLCKGFESRGTICLQSAKIGGDLAFLGAKTTKVDCTNLRLSGDMFWMRIQKPGEVFLILSGATLRNLYDDRESWPHSENLILDGLTYQELTHHGPPSAEQIMSHSSGPELPFNVEERIKWLMLQPEKVREKPQPWMQLRDLLEKKGDRKGAKYVLFRFRCLQAREKEFHPLLCLLKMLSWLKRIAIACVFHFRKTLRRIKPYLRHPNRIWAIVFAGLEEKPIRICWSIAFTLMVGWLIFARAFSSGAMLASGQIQPNAVLSNGESKNLSAPYPLSQSFLYTLENAVPLVKLGIDEKWMPDPKHKPQPWFPQFRWLDWLGWFNSYWFLVWSRVLLIFLGWFQAGVLGAALLKRFKE
jgi:hypothetical protein